MEIDYHYAVKLYFNKGTSLSVLFSDGITKRYDMMTMTKIHPYFIKLEDRKLFISGQLDWFGIVWNDEIDVDADEIYYEGILEPNREDATEALLGFQIKYARLKKELTQEQFSKIVHIDQADLSKIENAKLSPTLSTIKRIAKALDTTFTLTVN